MMLTFLSFRICFRFGPLEYLRLCFHVQYICYNDAADEAAYGECETLSLKINIVSSKEIRRLTPKSRISRK